MNGRILLAGVLRWEMPKLEETILHQDEYREIVIPKKNGAKRIIHEPHPLVKQFQRRFLKYFLYRTLKRDWMERHIVGFMPKRSIAENANYHLRPETHFTYSLDFQDAFPSITSEYLRRFLNEIVFEEIEAYARVIAGTKTTDGNRLCFPNPPLFSSRKVKWFRQLFRSKDEYILKHQPDPHAIIHEFVDEAMSLLTYQGKLPQGAPTSPYLLNLVVSRSHLLENIRSTLQMVGIGSTVTIWADDITISVARALPRSMIEEIYGLVEATGVFHLNSQKTRCFNSARIAPLVTGLRLVRYVPSFRQRNNIDTKELVNTNEAGWHRIRRPPHEKLLRDQHGKIQIVLTVSVPKKIIKKIRGIIHRAISNPELRPRVVGYIAFLRDIYGEVLPRQVARPYKQYCYHIRSQVDS